MGRIDNLPYKCGNLPNHTVAYGNNIYWTFWRCVRTTKPPVPMLILFNKNLTVINGGVINDN